MTLITSRVWVSDYSLCDAIHFRGYWMVRDFNFAIKGFEILVLILNVNPVFIP